MTCLRNSKCGLIASCSLHALSAHFTGLSLTSNIHDAGGLQSKSLNCQQDCTVTLLLLHTKIWPEICLLLSLAMPRDKTLYALTSQKDVFARRVTARAPADWHHRSSWATLLWGQLLTHHPHAC